MPDRSSMMLLMNRLSAQKREQIIALLVEGNSLRGIARIMDISFNTVLKYLPQVGNACADLHNRKMRNLVCRKVQCDEIWSYCHTKRKNLTPEKAGQLDYGDVWTFVAIDAETKLVPSWIVGKRTLETAKVFMSDLRARIVNRPQLSTDGFKAYAMAVDEYFGNNVDYGMLVKVYEDNNTDPQTLMLHSDAGIQSHIMTGNPQEISTSFVERQNATMRQSMRSFARRTTGFSKKFENHVHAQALHFFWYNFGRIHQTLRVTPAMAAGIEDHVWTFAELVELIDKFEDRAHLRIEK